MSALLSVSGVSKAFGGLQALSEVSLQVNAGEIFGLIGPNGAGKTTLFNALTGLYTIDRGEVRLGGIRVDGRKPHQVLKAGLARTFQNIRLFAEMTALENVLVGRHARTTSGVLGAVLRLPATVREEADAHARAQALLERVGIARHAYRMAKNLSYGDQRRLEIARALATDPTLLLLDEPTAGMNPQETREAEDLIFRIRDLGMAILVIEHDMKFIFNLCDRVCCLVRGEVLVEGSANEVQNDPRVIEAYLGTPDLVDEEDDDA